MFKTVRGKLLASSISILIIINIIFTIFIYLYLGNNFQKDMIDEMAKVKSAAVNIIKMNEVTQQPVWKSLYSINEMVDSYVAITDEQGEISQFTGIALLEEDLEKIINNSNNIKSLIKFKKEGSVYCVTYNYPIYLEQQLYGNLIIQKDYSNKYNNN